MARVRRQRVGFSLIELLVAIAVIAVLVAVLLPALSKARRVGRMAVCQSNLRQVMIAHAAYANDASERIATLSWEPNEAYGRRPALHYRAAAADQAMRIFEDRLNLTNVGLPSADLYGAWVPYVRHSHLVLMDYLSGELLEDVVVCPDDDKRLSWRRDPDGFLDLTDAERPYARSTADMLRWVYSSTYELAPAGYSPDMINDVDITTYQHGLRHRRYNVCTRRPMGTRTVSEVLFPSQKVAVFDTFARHDGRRDRFFAHEDAWQPLAFFDGHISVHRTADTNVGFRPNHPRVNAPSVMFYHPAPWEPPATDGSTRESVFGMYRWTRGGLRGVDVAGAEVSTEDAG